ncbi:hypothetical protein HAX54_033783 [Datura stramonium]|uniref:Uncharacterized protein n=1 Tax=Datura stramonium TaxID=4076 RepID=A0ABS8VE17_DATST|nr:hypothetical protein [Datura stramonium]
MKEINEQFVSFDKALASTLMNRLSSITFDRNCTMHEHIMEVRDIVAKLKSLEVMLSFGEKSHYPKGLPCLETIKLVDKMWHREEKKDAMLLVMMKKMEQLTSYVKGFHAKNRHVIQDYDDDYYGN